MNKKVLRNTIILSLAAIVLVVATVLTTIAYLTSSAAVANTFTVGSVGITMFESTTNQDGKIIAPDLDTGKKTANGNHYLLVPGHSYTKDPTIYVNKESQKSYLFIKVRNDIRNIEAGIAKDTNGNIINDVNQDTGSTMRKQLINNGWVQHHVTATDIVYVYNKLVGGEGEVQAINLFNEFTVDPNATDKELALYSAARVSITAYAIQNTPDAFGEYGEDGAVDKAWEAVVATYPYVPDASGGTPANH